MKRIFIIVAKLEIILILINLWICIVQSDPRALIYKGNVNIGLLIGAHSSTSTQSLCDGISVNGLHNSMANVWALHMHNQRQKLNNLDEIGVFIYDTCTDPAVTQRQTVRLVSHLFSVGNRVCRDSRIYPPLIGVIFDGQTDDKSLDLFKSFNVPIISTYESQFNDSNSTGNVFTVAPTIKYLSNAVMSLVKELNWQSMSLVVSDEEPAFDSQYLHSLSLKSHSDLNFISNYNNYNSNDAQNYSQTEDYLITSNKEKPKRHRRRDEQLSSNTIFYLSSSEAMDLLNSLSGSVDDSYNSMPSNYSYIIVTNQDISAQMKSSTNLKKSQKLKKNVFLVSPLMEKSSEYQNYFETMVNTDGTKGDQPLIAEYKKANETNVPAMSVSLMTKAVWALTLAYQNLFQRQCAGNKLNCNLSTNANLTEMMINSLKNLNAVISDSGLKDLNGVRLKFDSEGKLLTWKYQIMIVASNWQTINLGFYTLDNGLNIDSKFMQTILTNRVNRFRIRPKSMIKAIHKSGRLDSLPSNNMPLYKQSLYSNRSNQSIAPSSLMRSTIKHQLPSSSATIEKRTVLDELSPINTSTRSSSFESSYVTKKRYNSLTVWLGTVWSLIILCSSIMGILVTLYIQTFLLMKSCEGALRKANQALVICHLVAVAVTFLGSSLYVFYPTSMICCMRHTIHNISVTMLFGSLLIRAMYIRAQKSIGLGGRTSRLNQLLTLFFIVGIQTALEFQKWKYEFSWITKESETNLKTFCMNDGYEYMRSQIYITIILSLLLLMCWAARDTPFNQRDGNQVLFISLLMTLVYIASMVAIMNINKPKLSDTIIGISMNIYAFLVLLGLFVPLLHTIHKYGVLVPKSGSYADSLSTIFTSFGGAHDLTDSYSHNSSQSHKSKEFLNTKLSKSFDFHNTTNFFARVSPNCYTNPIQSPYKFNRNKCSLMHNTLYEGVPGFRSAYP